VATKVLVRGAGGFIGDHPVTYLKSLGYWIRGVDAKLPEFRRTTDDFLKLKSQPLSCLARPAHTGRRFV
jgi:nucleoside-diphosphate-sugar epimerase